MSSDQSEDSFATLFEKSGQVPQRGRGARVGQEVDAIVVQVGKDAVFVEYEGHRQGFIEVIDLPSEASVLTVGQSIRARVSQSDPEHGVRLVPVVHRAVTAVPVRSAATGPQENQTVKVVLGQVVSGVVQRVELYGVFLQVDGTRGREGRGLLPTAELGVPRGTDLRKAFPLGARLKAKVLDLGEGKMRLSLSALKDDEERAQFDGFRANEGTAPPPTLGTFGDLLKRQNRR